MLFSTASYDSETLSVLNGAFDEAWREFQRATHSASEYRSMEVTRTMMALRIMTAANEGERDPDRLKEVAIRAVDGKNFG